ncbi:DUF1461 domain-containing protein [Eubacteriales bacterium KG127]
MKKVNYIISYVLIVCFLIALVCVSSTIALHLKSTYDYHFNDGAAFKKINSPVPATELSSGVTKYFVMPTKDKFQIYEVNGKYKDPIFNIKEQRIMEKIKKIITFELFVGVFSAAAFFACYVYMYKKGFKEAIRNRIKASICIGFVLIIIRVIIISIKSFRYGLYNWAIGINLGKKTLLIAIFGDPFFKTYLLFASMGALMIIGITLYINQKLTKPERIFY